MTYSKTHAEVFKKLKDQKVLTHPEDFLGPNWKEVLDFWSFIDTLSEEEKLKMNISYCALVDGLHARGWGEAYHIAEEVVGDKVRDAAYLEANYTTRRWIFGVATLELIANLETKVAHDLIMKQ
jgi:hypothetical protein